MTKANSGPPKELTNERQAQLQRRKQRLAARLQENLKKRKNQQKLRVSPKQDAPEATS